MKKPRLFISYSRKDKKFVHRLCQELDAKGINYWLDSKDILAGDSISERIESGLRESDLFCLCLSESSVARPWVSREYRAALNLQLSSEGKGIRIVPLLVQDCEIPELLRDIRYADFSSNFMHGFRALCDVLQIRFEFEVPYQRLLSHIESREPLINFIRASKKHRRSNLEQEWAHQMFSLLKEGILATKRELEEFLKTRTPLMVMPRKGKLPRDSKQIPVIISEAIVLDGGYNFFSDDYVEPYDIAVSGFIEFLEILSKRRKEILELKLYLIPESFSWDVSTYPDGEYDEGVELSQLINSIMKG